MRLDGENIGELLWGSKLTLLIYRSKLEENNADATINFGVGQDEEMWAFDSLTFKQP
jgi:hypothetical protein